MTMEKEEIKDLLGRYINERLVLAVVSNSPKGSECTKAKLRPVKIKGEVLYQLTRTVGAKELHSNHSAVDAVNEIIGLLEGGFRQAELKNDDTSAVILVGKKGTVTVKEHKVRTKESAVSDGSEKTGSRDKNNRDKNYVLPEGTPVGFLVDLGVMTKEGRVVAARYDKFRQINRYLEFVEDIIPSLPKNREISIIDFGCGKSYLTFALYYYLHEKRGYDVRITGLDLKADVIAECSALAKRFGYEKLSFLHGDIADYTGTDSVDMVVTLHACDTATDYALYKALKWGAKVIFCVPCCQHEVNRQIKNEAFKEVFKYGLIKERMSALLTDSLRACILEEQGYKTQILEFIDMEHTPKNILIRAVKKTGLPIRAEKEAGKLKAQSYRDLMNEFEIKPTLFRLLEEHEGKQ